jgi:hypothetical protein
MPLQHALGERPDLAGGQLQQPAQQTDADRFEACAQHAEINKLVPGLTAHDPHSAVWFQAEQAGPL